MIRNHVVLILAYPFLLYVDYIRYRDDAQFCHATLFICIWKTICVCVCVCTSFLFQCMLCVYMFDF